ncbi:molybdenum cofactor biosynthesis protein MoaE [Robiginitomaculum antarcticum]|uniref:molybdenum cofactor biosynthesis protein MoaE n=1 Tax=Robiginitomaculum antarcticum TaxID=437507 RepID=UPI00039E3FD6|nr:molybdenum cofactor biosynthesis protein MoaE [Robiginitomaculum antarcticum]
MSARARLTQDIIDNAKVEADFSSIANMAGAAVTFRGVMRPLTKQGERLDTLVLKWHPRMTEKSLDDIARNGLSRFGVDVVRVIHRCGPIAPGETIVFVGVASDHRREAFQAADYVMDRLKTDAVFWKREEGPFGTRWIEPTDRDHNDRKRWSK